MPKVAKELSAVQVGRLKAAGLHSVGGIPGLHLQITDSGARSWILRATVGSKRRDIGLGGFPAVTLAKAREAARNAREEIFRGLDPVEERARRERELVAQQAIPTFDECSDKFLSTKTAEFRNAKHREQWRTTLKAYASPKIGRLPIPEVGLPQILEVLQPIWTTKTETASRLRGRIERVISWATVAGYRSGDNPARWRGNLDAVLPKPSKVKKVRNHPALPYAELARFLDQLRVKGGTGARAVELAVLTAARSIEVRGAAWKEFDLDKAIWIVPAGRMKASKEHTVPLSDQAVRVLRAIPNDSKLVFPSEKGKKLSDATLGKVIRDMHKDDVELKHPGFLDPRLGRVATLHGFRSTFRDWAGETTSFPREVIEHALAHQIKDKVEAAYARGTLFDKRRKLMEAWGRFCATRYSSGKVVALHRKSAA